MILQSTAFSHHNPIPARYTADGADVSPPLAWHEPPANTKSFALIVDDPDAPGGAWTHWVIYNIPALSRSLAEHVPPSAHLPPAVKQGKNDFHNIGYGGPSPPSGVHRYVFTLYALDAELDLPAGASKRQLLAAMKGRILAEATLIGIYRRGSGRG